MLDFNSLTTTPSIRSRVVTVPDLGDVKIYELSTLDKWSHTDEVAALGDQPDPGTDRAGFLEHNNAQESVLANTVARVLAGPGVEIPPEKVEALSRNLSSEVMLELYRAASKWDYVPGEDQAQEDPVKNS